MQLTLSLWTVLIGILIGMPILFVLCNIPYIKRNWRGASARWAGAWPTVWRCGMGTIFGTAGCITLGITAYRLGESGMPVGLAAAFVGLGVIGTIAASIISIVDEIN